jgi:hypothetical protein
MVRHRHAQAREPLGRRAGVGQDLGPVEGGAIEEPHVDRPDPQGPRHACHLWQRQGRKRPGGDREPHQAAPTVSIRPEAAER